MNHPVTFRVNGTFTGAALHDLELYRKGDGNTRCAPVEWLRRRSSGEEVPMGLKDGTETTIGIMEVSRVVDGRITEVWNCGYKQGVWQ